MDATDADVFRLYFDRAPDLLCVAGPDGRFRRLNPSWSRVLGWSEAELLARPWLDFVHPDDRQATIEAGRILLAQGEVIDFVNRYACRDGSWRWLSWHSQFLADSGLILATVRDITEQRRLQHRLDEAERQVAAVLQHAPFGLHLWSIADDGQLRLAAANPAADRFTGVRTADLLGSTIEEAFPDTVRAGLPARYRAVAEGSAPPFELRSLPYSDGIISGHFDVWTFQVGTGRMAALFVEVTERLRAENEIRRSREDLRITLDSIGDGVIATDASGKVTRINPVAHRLTGWSEAEACGRPIEEVFHIVNAESGRRVESPVSRVLREGQVVGLANHTALVRKDGQRIQIADSGAPIRDAQNAIVGAVLVFRDVTEEYALQRQLHQAQKMEAIGQLAGGIAHDFNNLLAGVLGAAEMLTRQTQLEGRQREWLQLITATATRAAELTQKLLAVGRKGQAQTVAIELQPLIHQVAGILEHTLDKRIQLHLDLPSEGIVTRGDPSQIQSAILNLAINARDAMAGGGVLRIALASAELAGVPPCRHHMGELNPGRHLAISVTDTGCGIPGAHIERIFEPFFTTKGPGEGSGLGLPSVYAAVKNHGGAVTIDSEPGVGSTFTLYLPQVDPDPGTSRIRRAVRGAGAGRRLLVVDDEPAVRGAMVAWLQADGYAVVEAEDGEAGLQLLRQQEFDAVLLDLVMPRLSGPEAFRSYRALRPQLPILLMSGYNLHGSRADQLLGEGAAGFLQKPFRLDDLSAAVARVLS